MKSKIGLRAARGTSRNGLYHYGDIVVAVDGKSDYMSEGDLIAHFFGKKPGDKVKLTILRDGERVEVEAAVR